MADPGKPDFTGNQNISEQTLGKVATTSEITANTANQFDGDVNNYDLIEENGYETSEANISGSQEVVIKGQSEAAVNVFVDWTDGNGNVEYTNSPDAAQNTTDFDLLFPTGSTHFQVRIEDTSGNSQNQVDATVNAH